MTKIFLVEKKHILVLKSFNLNNKFRNFKNGYFVNKSINIDRIYILLISYEQKKHNKDIYIINECIEENINF